MLFTLYRTPALPRQNTRWRRLRITLLMGLAFTMSACANDATYYRSYSGYAGYYPDYYVQGYYGSDQNPYGYPPNYARQPDWKTYGRHHDTQPWHRLGPYRQGLQTQKRIERERYYQLQQYRDSMQEKRRDGDHRNRIGPKSGLR